MTKEEEANLTPAAVIHVDTNENDRKPPSCCLCLNVRDGAVLIGLFNLVRFCFNLTVFDRPFQVGLF